MLQIGGIVGMSRNRRKTLGSSTYLLILSWKPINLWFYLTISSGIFEITFCAAFIIVLLCDASLCLDA